MTSEPKERTWFGLFHRHSWSEWRWGATYILTIVDLRGNEIIRKWRMKGRYCLTCKTEHIVKRGKRI